MSRKEPASAIFTTIALCGLLLATERQGMAQTDQRHTVASRTVMPSPSKGMAAIDAAATNDKYLFIFFWKANDANTQSMFQVFQSAMGKWADSADSIAINIATSDEKPMVDKFGVSRAPMPLVLAMAPSGAITKGLPIKFDENQLQEAFVSPCTAKCMKALQDRKLVLLCVQNEKTQFSQAALTGALGFKGDARFAAATEVVTLNPEDEEESGFLQTLKVSPQTPQAVTVLLAPPGQPVATFAGAVSKDQIIAKVQAGPCAGGKCGPGGCCPPKK